MRLRIGTRGSKLALWQARYVAGLLREVDAGVDIVADANGEVVLDASASTDPDGHIWEISSWVKKE